MAKIVHVTKPPFLGHTRNLTSLLRRKTRPGIPISSSSFSHFTTKHLTTRATAAMVKAIRVYELGGPEVLKWEDVEVGEPKEGEIRVKNKAIGLNFIDVYFRQGVYKAALPFIPGREAVGVVTAVGPGLTGMRIGDVVGYAGNPMGSYTEEQILPADVAVPVPSSIDPIVVASVMLKGMTTQFLVRRCFKVEPGHTVLVHAAAGGVGSLLCQWANALGATVIGTVSTEAKAAQAKEDGCHHVILYKQEDFVASVDKITSGKGVDVVYDSVGKDTFQGSFSCLKLRGYMVSFGQSSGTPDPVPLSALAAKSLFLTRPSLMQYNATRDELLKCAGEVFANVASGVLKVRVNHTYPLSHAAQAHADLEARKTSGESEKQYCNDIGCVWIRGSEETSLKEKMGSTVFLNSLQQETPTLSSSLLYQETTVGVCCSKFSPSNHTVMMHRHFPPTQEKDSFYHYWRNHFSYFLLKFSAILEVGGSNSLEVVEIPNTFSSFKRRR